MNDDEMNDEQRMEKWRKVTDPKEALQVLVENRVFVGNDPYYRDLNAELWEMAERCAEGAATAPRFRVDYVTTTGERGEWHCDAEADGAETVIGLAGLEVANVARRLKRDTDKVLSELVVVEITERDVGHVVP